MKTKALEWTRKEETQENPRTDSKHRFKITAPKLAAGGINFDNGIELEASVHYNGSGPQAFGGAPKWPVAKLTVSFEQGKFSKRDKFIAALQTFIHEYPFNS